MIRDKFIRPWTHKDKIDNRVFSLILPNTKRLNIVTVILENIFYGI